MTVDVFDEIEQEVAKRHAEQLKTLRTVGLKIAAGDKPTSAEVAKYTAAAAHFQLDANTLREQAEQAAAAVKYESEVPTQSAEGEAANVSLVAATADIKRLEEELRQARNRHAAANAIVRNVAAHRQQMNAHRAKAWLLYGDESEVVDKLMARVAKPVHSYTRDW